MGQPLEKHKKGKELVPLNNCNYCLVRARAAVNPAEPQLVLRDPPRQATLLRLGGEGHLP